MMVSARPAKIAVGKQVRGQQVDAEPYKGKEIRVDAARRKAANNRVEHTPERVADFLA